MFHICHSAQNGQHHLRRTCKTESPRCHAVFRFTTLQTFHHMLRNIRQASAKQRFHYNCRDIAFLKFAIKIFSIYIVALCMTPVYIVHLYLHKIPVHLVVHGQNFIEHIYRTVERESQTTYSAGLALFHQIIDHAVVDISVLEHVDTAVSDRMQQIKINIVYLKFLERLLIHVYRILTRPVAEI